MPLLNDLAHFMKTEGARLPIDALHFRKRLRMNGVLISSPVLPFALNSMYWFQYARELKAAPLTAPNG